MNSPAAIGIYPCLEANQDDTAVYIGQGGHVLSKFVFREILLRFIRTSNLVRYTFGLDETVLVPP